MPASLIDPVSLLEFARDLIVFRPKAEPYDDIAVQTALRRSVSASYYALFSYVQERGADTLVGARAAGTAAYVTLYGVDYDPTFKASYNTAYGQHARAARAIEHLQAINNADRMDLIIRLMLKERDNRT